MDTLPLFFYFKVHMLLFWNIIQYSNMILCYKNVFRYPYVTDLYTNSMRKSLS